MLDARTFPDLPCESATRVRIIIWACDGSMVGGVLTPACLTSNRGATQQALYGTYSALAKLLQRARLFGAASFAMVSICYEAALEQHSGKLHILDQACNA